LESKFDLVFAPSWFTGVFNFYLKNLSCGKSFFKLIIFAKERDIGLINDLKLQFLRGPVLRLIWLFLVLW